MTNTKNNPEPEPAKGQFFVYRAESGDLKLDVRFEDESVWLTQQLMADLFQTNAPPSFPGSAWECRPQGSALDDRTETNDGTGDKA